MDWRNIPRELWIGGLVFFFALAMFDAGFWAIIGLVFVLMLARNAFDGGNNNTHTAERPRRNTRRSTPNYSFEEDFAEGEAPLSRTRRTPTTLPDHVLEAITTAGHDPDNLPVRPMDIGVLVYREGVRDPEMHRMNDIPKDAKHIRPFVQLNLPQNANGRIRFELIDSAGTSRFVQEDSHQLKQGTQPIIASTWLPVGTDLPRDGMWQLKVSADDVLLANHLFEWQGERVEPEITEYMEEDGEISDELRTALGNLSNEKMSLDELLGDQGEIKGQASRRR
ncbi:MAG: hypothetical protein MUF87_20605 [Anaerolineae bacterium]|jgi:hypothetical protein|nr:hypothetical protein [Anaerolineae bacterium]